MTKKSTSSSLIFKLMEKITSVVKNLYPLLLLKLILLWPTCSIIVNKLISILTTLLDTLFRNILCRLFKIKLRWNSSAILVLNLTPDKTIKINGFNLLCLNNLCIFKESTPLKLFFSLFWENFGKIKEARKGINLSPNIFWSTFQRRGNRKIFPKL